MRHQLQVLVAAALVLVLGYLGYVLLFGPERRAELVVVDARGTARRVDVDGSVADLEAGMALDRGQRVQVGADGEALLGLGPSSRLRLDAGSTLRVLAVEPSGVRVELEDGRLHATVRPDGPALGVHARGRAVFAEDADLAVGVDDGGGVSVRADRGGVRLDGFGQVDALDAGETTWALPDRPAVRGPAGEELLLDVRWPEGAVARGEVDLEGRTSPYAAVRIGGPGEAVTTRAGADGHFRARVPLSEGENDLRVEARDPLGRVASDRHAVERDSTAPAAQRTEVQWGR